MVDETLLLNGEAIWSESSHEVSTKGFSCQNASARLESAAPSSSRVEFKTICTQRTKIWLWGSLNTGLNSLNVSTHLREAHCGEKNRLSACYLGFAAQATCVITCMYEHM